MIQAPGHDNACDNSGRLIEPYGRYPSRRSSTLEPLTRDELLSRRILAGVEGFEPPNGGIKTRFEVGMVGITVPIPVTRVASIERYAALAPPLDIPIQQFPLGGFAQPLISALAIGFHGFLANVQPRRDSHCRHAKQNQRADLHLPARQPLG